MIDTMHTYINEQVQRQYPEGDKSISRQYVGHLVWSMLIDIEPRLKEFAPANYLGA